MSANATHVPTNGFSGVPNAGAPAVPVPDGQSAAQLPPGVPPAGPPALTPQQRNSSEPIALPGQTPGYVPQQPAALPATPAQAAQAPAGTPDLTNVVALLQQALGTQAPAAAPAAATPAGQEDRPDWLKTSVADFDISTIDDPIIRSMATVLQTAGKDIDLDRAISKALKYGDAGLVDVAYLTEKGGANAAQLVTIAQGLVQSVTAQSDAIMSEVYSTTGGEAGWDASVASFNTSAPQALRTTVAAMLDSTNKAQIKAGAQIIAEFGRAGGHIPQQGAPLLNAAAGSSASAQGLDKRGFQAELRKLDVNSPDYNEQRENLFSRREIGRRLGK